MTKKLLVLTTFTLIACSKQIEPKQETWSIESGKPAPEISRSNEFRMQETVLLTNNELLERSPQMWGSAFIENSFLVKIFDRSGKLIFINQSFIDQDWGNLDKRIQNLDQTKYQNLEKIKKWDSRLSQATEIYPPKVVLALHLGIKEPFYQIDYLDKNKSGVYRLRVLPPYSVISNELVSSAFEQGHGWVFPEGPKISELTEVVIKELLGDGTLSKKYLKVTAQTPEKVKNSENIFKYDPTDVRFDQVQTFYFVDKALNFFKNDLGITLPFPIEVQTHMGNPDKTNAMFYYHGQIRFGTGDGIAYENIMRDPSIVIHEASHALVEALSRLPMGQGEGGSLNEAFADYFTASFLDNPNMAEVAYIKGPFKRTLDNQMTTADKKGGLYNDSLIASGTLWEIRSALGDKQANFLASKTLLRMGPTGNFSNFRKAIEFALEQGFKPNEKQSVTEILNARGWK